MKKLLLTSSILILTTLGGCVNVKKSSTSIPGTYSDQCNAPKSSFVFQKGGSGVINARGITRNFTWIQKGQTAYASVPASGGTPSQTYVLRRTQSGVYLSNLTINGQPQDLSNIPSNERIKVRC